MTDPQPGLHPDDVRAGLAEAAGRRCVAERDRAEAMLDIRDWTRRAQVAGVPITEVASITGLSRMTVYDLIRDR